MGTIRPLNFSDISKACSREQHEHRAFTHSCCEKPAQAFFKNIDRLMALSAVTAYSFHAGGDWEKSFAEAMRRTRLQDQMDSETIGIALRLVKTLRNSRTESDFVTCMFKAKSTSEIVLSIGPYFKDSLHTIFESMIIQAWTAFEVLARDLLISVFDERKSLDRLGTWTEAEQRNSGFINHSQLANYYRWTFREDNLDILMNVESTAVHALSLLRNVLVQAGGEIDADFQEGRKGFYKGVFSKQLQPFLTAHPIPELDKINQANIGEKIELTGSHVRLLIDEVTPMGFGLLRAVDEWLVAHPGAP